MTTAHSPRHQVFLGAQHFSSGKGGIAAVACLTAKALIQWDMDMHLLSLLDDRDGEFEGIKWRSTRGNRISFLARCHLATLRCRHFVYDSVSTAQAHPRATALRRPYALWIHGVEVWYALRKGRERALRGADLVLVNSSTTLDRFRRLHGELENARVCWLATDADDAPIWTPSFDGPPTVLALGTANLEALHKGQKELIACWQEVVAAVPDARLVLAGGGNGVDYLRGLAQASPVFKNITVKGYVSPADISDLWRSASVFALPSRKEGFGLVYAEAMRHRLPIVASVHDAGQEVNLDGETGFNVDLDTPGELADRLVRLLSSPDLARRMGQNGHARWHEHFRFSAFEKRFKTILQPHLEA